MPESDFTIGLRTGSGLVGEMIGDRQNQASLDMKAKQMEISRLQDEQTLKQSSAHLDLQKKILEERSLHSSVVETGIADEIRGRKADRDRQAFLIKSEAEGLERVNMFRQRSAALQLADPQGINYKKNAIALSAEFGDVMSHQSPSVSNAAKSVYAQGEEFARQSDMSAVGKEIQSLVDGSFLKEQDRGNPQMVMAARSLRDTQDLESFASSNGTSLTEVLGEGFTPESSPSGGLHPAFLLGTKNMIARLAASRAEQRKAPVANLRLEKPVLDATGKPVKSGIGGSVLTSKMETTMEEIERSPALRKLADSYGYGSGAERRFNIRAYNKATKKYEEGSMSETNYRLNIQAGNAVEIIGAQ